MITSVFGIEYEKAFEEFTIQPCYHADLVGWIESGIKPSLFIQRVLSNDLAVVFMSEDRRDQAAVRGIVRFLVKYAPGECWGSANTAKWERERAVEA